MGMAAAAGLSIVASSIGAYSSIKQGQFQKQMAYQQAAELELQSEATKTQRAGERVDEASQQLQRARQLDTLFREQRLATATSGLSGGSFAAMQANDLANFTREQNLFTLSSSSKDATTTLQLEALKRQISSTRASGNFAYKMGLLGAGSGLLSTSANTGMAMSKG
jgi:hypothetical protein